MRQVTPPAYGLIWSLPLCISFVIVVALYWPGTNGSFLLDDYSSLSMLGSWGTLDNFNEYFQYVFSGGAGPGGRPVSLATFALNSNVWPASPKPFLVTNVFIHAFNGLLVYFFIISLTKNHIVDVRRQRLFALLASTIWALHPFQATTVLYIVQRMTMLSATFMLLALVVYLAARRKIQLEHYIQAAGFGCLTALFAVLAFYSKENAVLIPIYIVLIEWYLRLVEREVPNRANKILFVGVVLPFAVIVFMYPVKLFFDFAISCLQSQCVSPNDRNYTVLERLYTEQRVVGSYIRDIVIPKIPPSGIFFDNFAISKSIIEPKATLFWTIFHSAVLIIAFKIRKVRPVIFFGILWFYGSHLIESTSVMLELKFDHRNYLAIIGFSMLLADILFSLTKWLKASLAAVHFVMYAVILLMTTQLWGFPIAAAEYWLSKNSESPRLNDFAADAYLRIGDIEKAKYYMQRNMELTQAAASSIKYISVFCDTPDRKAIRWGALASGLQNEKRDWGLYIHIKQVLDNYVSGSCDKFDLDGYIKLLNAYRGNEYYKNNLSFYVMDDLELRALLEFGREEDAIEVDRADFNRLLPLSIRMNRALIFASYGLRDYAAKELGRQIMIAKELNSEDPFTMENAIEMKQLIETN